jgi:hypothetical protein
MVVFYEYKLLKLFVPDALNTGYFHSLFILSTVSVVSLILKIPTINDKPKDFDCLFQLWQQVQEDTKEVIFDFSECYFLRQNPGFLTNNKKSIYMT